MASLRKIEKELDKELKEVEAWVHQRRKFFKKLFLLAGILLVILIISHIWVVYY